MQRIPFLLGVLPGIVLVAAILTAGCGDSVSPPDSLPSPEIPDLPARGFYMGALPIPADGQSFEDVHTQLGEYAEFVPIWGRPSPFYHLSDDLAGEWGALFAGSYLRDNGLFPIVHFSFIGQGMTVTAPPGMEGATLADPAWRDAYKKAVLDVAGTCRPRYLSLGNEVNRWYEKHGADDGTPDGFRHFVTLYEELYTDVKEVSPETLVFCVFAREIVSENREADLEVLRLFDPKTMDLLVMTSYPYAVRGINRPSDIPADYYSRAAGMMPATPFGFSELGWPSMDAFGGEAGQASFLARATGDLTRDRGVDLHLVGWAWLHDLDANDDVGLIERDGTEKESYRMWKEISRAGA
jgi:hypothetical protein